MLVPPHHTDPNWSVVVQYLKKHWPVLAATGETVVASGGFSGAVVLKVRGSNGEHLALRRWPTTYREIRRLQGLHRVLKYLKQSGLPVAVPLSSTGNETLVSLNDGLWQLEPWLPGDPLSPNIKNHGYLNAVMQCLAHLHAALARYQAPTEEERWFGRRTGASPSTMERLELLNKYASRRMSLGSGFPNDTETQNLARRILAVFDEHHVRIQNLLTPLSDQTFNLQPCWRDLWYPHVLMQAGHVTGFLDPAAMRTAHVATDISRLLGGLCGNSRETWDYAIDAYYRLHPLNPVELRLIHALDQSGVLLSILNWLDRPQELASSSEARQRCESLLMRLEQPASPGGVIFVK
ncbi:MAG: phosphotransferase [Planctomycetaceae bacterium]